jgi:ABC-type molybdate transport system ATPase subunit
LAAEVTAVRLEAGAFAEIQVRTGPVPLVARITRPSAARLQIVRGRRLFAVIKAVTIDPGALSLPLARS